MATLLVSLGLYLTTMAPGILWGDSGDAQLRVLLGRWWNDRALVRAHAPYYLAAIGVTATGLASAAKAANLIAAIAGAVTVANINAIIALITPSWIARVAGTLLLLLSHALWQMSCGAEVVTFSTMCLSAELICVIKLLQTKQPRFLVLAALVHGLGWSTHNLALLTLPAYCVLLVVRSDLLRTLRWRDGVAALGAWIFGCAPLIYLVFKSLRESGDLGGTMQSLLVGQYGSEVSNLSVSAGMIAEVIAHVGLNFPTPLLLLAPWGWWRMRRFATPGVWWFLSVAGLTHFLFAVRYDVPDQYTFMVHSYLFLSICIAVGIAGFLDKQQAIDTGSSEAPQHRRPFHRLWAPLIITLSLLSPMLYACLPAIVHRVPALAKRIDAQTIPYRDAAHWFLQPWRTGDDGAEKYAREVLNSLPPDACFLARRTRLRPVEYLQVSEKLRPDLSIGESARAKLMQNNRPDEDAILSVVAARRFYIGSNRDKYLPEWLEKFRFQFIPEGLVYRVAFGDTATSVGPGEE